MTRHWKLEYVAREWVLTVMMCAARLAETVALHPAIRGGGSSNSGSGGGGGGGGGGVCGSVAACRAIKPSLPCEMWLHILSFVSQIDMLTSVRGAASAAVAASTSTRHSAAAVDVDGRNGMGAFA
jgi:hypothetical protein